MSSRVQDPASVTLKRSLKCRSLLPYYGGKSKLAHLYSNPIADRIIEPFAGGAAYSLLHYEREVWLNDLYGPTVSAWRFLISNEEALHLVRERIPPTVKPGTRFDELVLDHDPEGFKWLIRAHMAQGAFGTPGGIRNRVSPFGADAWSAALNGTGGLRARLEYWIPRISHWKVTQLPYQELPNQRATWFVDPPYKNEAGRLYVKSDVDYTELAGWCKLREGQLIVCENNGGTWLPFRVLTERRRGIYCKDVKSEMGEAVYEQGSDGSGEIDWAA
jgi:hypothetical protein